MVTPRLEGRVLLVDDTEAKRYVVATSLRLAGMEVLEAASAREGLVAAALLPELIILDVRLPDMSGFEVCRRLKEDPGTAAIPVLYISTLIQDEELEARLFEDGADGYVPQPIEPKHLVAQAWALVRMRRAELQRERERTAAQLEQQVLRRELESSERHLRLALEAAELGAWSYDFDTQQWHWDKRARAMFGLAPETPLDLEVWRSSVHPDDWPGMMDLMRRAREGEQGGVFGTEFRTLGLQDGVLRWLAVSGRFSFDARAQPRQASGIWVDITERKLADKRAAELLATTAAFAHALTTRQVADAMLEHGLHSLEAHSGSVSLVEGESLRVLGEFGHPESLVEACRVMPLGVRTPLSEAVLTGQTVWVMAGEGLAREWPEFARHFDVTRSRSWLCVPLTEGEQVQGVLGLGFTTPRRFSASERTHLESLCQLCTQALLRARLFEEERRQKEETQRRAEREQQFLGMVSHDLRNPLQAIALGARTLQRLERPSPEALLRLSERIATSADTMGRMVSDLLDFTRGRLGGGIPLERTAGDLMRVVREVLDEFALTHPSSAVVLEAEAVCEGSWDGPRMRQVLSNLLSNALRHARAGTAVKVRVRDVGTEVELSVHNEGEPIPEDLLPVLFEPFRRGHSNFRPAGSLGLGLYIVSQVVEGHGGRVGVESGPLGITFTVRLPRRAEGAGSR